MAKDVRASVRSVDGRKEHPSPPPPMPDGVAAVGERSKRQARGRVCWVVARLATRTTSLLYHSNPFRRCHSRSSEDVTSSNEFQGVTNCRQPRVLVSVRFLATPPGESVVRKRGIPMPESQRVQRQDGNAKRRVCSSLSKVQRFTVIQRFARSGNSPRS